MIGIVLIIIDRATAIVDGSTVGGEGVFSARECRVSVIAGIGKCIDDQFLGIVKNRTARVRSSV